VTERFVPEDMVNPEHESKSRLETYLVFVRHGKAAALPGSDTSNQLDAIRHHTSEGEQQVYNAGVRLADEISLQPNDLVLQRSSHRLRARQTATGALQGFIDTQQARGVETINLQASVKPGRESLSFPSVTARGDGPYAIGSARRGTSSGLSEEWTRHPDLFQQDIEEAGLSDDAEQTLEEMQDSFQRQISVVDRATRLLEKRWESRRASDSDVAPRLVLIEGSHGFVSEPWLQEVVRDYEQDNGVQVPLELSYGEYFVIHFPTNSAEPVTFRVKDHTIPIKPEFLAKIKE